MHAHILLKDPGHTFELSDSVGRAKKGSLWYVYIIVCVFVWGSMKPKLWFVGGLVLVTVGKLCKCRWSVDLFVVFGACV